MSSVRRRALLIGNAQFPESQSIPEGQAGAPRLPPLKGPPNDVRSLAAALSHPQVGLHDSADVKTLIDADHQQIIQEIDDFFASAGRADQLLLYYSGHGVRDNAGRLWLCARNTRTWRLASTAVPDSTISASFDGSRSSRIAVILDCCYSGSFKGDGDLQPPFAGSGRFILTSGRALDLSSDAQEIGGLSAFTHFIVDGLLAGDVDADGDGFVTISEVYTYAFGRVKELTLGQTPQRRFDDADGELVLGRAMPRAPVAPPAQTAPPQPAKLELSPEEITLRGIRLGERIPDDIVEVYSPGGGTLDWSVECAETWLRAEKVHGGLRLAYSPTVGPNRANVYVRDRKSGARKVLRVLVDVQAAAPPQLVLDSSPIDFGTVTKGVVINKSIRFHNLGGGTLELRAASDHPSVYARVLGDVLDIGLSRSATGEILAKVRVESNGGAFTIAVRAVIDSGPLLKIDPQSVDFGEVRFGGRVSATVKIRNAGSGQLTWKAIPDATPDIDLVAAGAELVIHFDGKHPGPMRGSVRIESNGGTIALSLVGAVKPAKPPPQPAAPAGLAGVWLASGQGGTALHVTPAAGGYAFREVNMLGVVVSEGSLTPLLLGYRIAGINLLAGVFEGTVNQIGDTLSGVVQTLHGAGPVQYVRSK